MKNLVVFFIFTLCLSYTLHAQQPAPRLLKEPADWPFEQFTLPPVFAPGFPYKGVEELRFSPGMFNKDSSNYFSYAFVAELDNLTSISQDGVKNYLLGYFKGLCGTTANDRKLIIDTSAITVLVKKNKEAAVNETIYDALLNVFGVFTDGAPVKLNMEVKVLEDKAGSKIYLVCIASPQEKSHAAWRQLHTIQQDFAMPAPQK